nr:MAG TPA: hypothetical protein [Caudoviricetes sp.]
MLCFSTSFHGITSYTNVRNSQCRYFLVLFNV